jgi:POTRA domain, FtsQ-type
MTSQAGDVTQQGAGGPGGPGPDAARPGSPVARPPHTPWRAVFFALAVVAIVAGVAWALLESRFFVVRSVQVTGTHLVTGAEVRSAAAIPPGLPLIRVNGAAVAHRVEQIRQVESARVSRDWPDGITIAVTERTPALAVRTGNGYQLIDRFGVAVESASRRSRYRGPCRRCGAARRCTRRRWSSTSCRGISPGRC